MNVKRIFVLLCMVIGMVSCSSDVEKADNKPVNSAVQEKKKQSDLVFDDQKSELSESEIALAKKWLIHAIENLFSDDLGHFGTITTKDYEAYKIDAMNLEYDHGLSPEVFERKWKGKFDVSKKAYGKGFLIDAQDNGKITVKKCTFLRNEGMYGCVFQVVLYDELFKSSYKSDVTVWMYEGSWAISDVEDHFIR